VAGENNIIIFKRSKASVDDGRACTVVSERRGLHGTLRRICDSQNDRC